MKTEYYKLDGTKLDGKPEQGQYICHYVNECIVYKPAVKTWYGKIKKEKEIIKHEKIDCWFKVKLTDLTPKERLILKRHDEIRLYHGDYEGAFTFTDVWNFVKKFKLNAYFDGYGIEKGEIVPIISFLNIDHSLFEKHEDLEGNPFEVDA